MRFAKRCSVKAFRTVGLEQLYGFASNEKVASLQSSLSSRLSKGWRGEETLCTCVDRMNDVVEYGAATDDLAEVRLVSPLMVWLITGSALHQILRQMEI